MKLGMNFVLQEKYKKILYLLLLTFAILPIVKIQVALLMGIAFGISFGNPYLIKTKLWSKRLLKVSVVGLGFSLTLNQIWSTGKQSFFLTIMSIIATLVLGNLLGKFFKTNKNVSTLISFGTAICGGSAIAAIAPIIKSKDEEIAISMAIVFALNSIGLILFPYLGDLLEMDQKTFGLWAALAIHDTSSVVGATAAYGSVALAIGTTVKLTRALWIIPFSMGIGWLKKSENPASFPLFIFGFVLAAALNSFLPQFSGLWEGLTEISKQTLVVTLFLVGSGLTRDFLQSIGLRAFGQAFTLWIIISLLSLIMLSYQKL